LLLDVNNVFISAVNLGFTAKDFIERFPMDLVGEIHLGGHYADQDEGGAVVLIDNHGHPVADPVWALYAATIARGGPKPTLIEWDNDVPEWQAIVSEAARAATILEPLS
jgi:hypothetical protein